MMINMVSRTEYMKDWRKNNPEKIKGYQEKYCKKNRKKLSKYQKDFARQHKLVVNGKLYYINKRPHTDICELCNKKIDKRMQWHHWDDDKLEMGMWICTSCHSFAEKIEECGESIVTKYLGLKEKIRKEYILQHLCYIEKKQNTINQV